MRRAEDSRAVALTPLSLWLALAFLFAAPAEAATFREAEVRQAVETWVRHTTPDARAGAAVERMEPFVEAGETVAWIAHLQGGGFCLAGADPVVLPVYVYVPTGTPPAGDPSARFVLEEIAGRTQLGRAALRAGSDAILLGQLADRADLWTSLISGRPRAAEAEKSAPSWLRLPANAIWDQPDPYNGLLPELTPSTGERTLVGCNAVATAQIMYWWKWPWTGVGSDAVSYNYRYRTNWDTEPCSVYPGSLSAFAGRLQWNANQLRMNGYWDGSVYGAAQNVSSNGTYQAALAALWSRMNAVPTSPVADFEHALYDWNQIGDSHSPPYSSEDWEVAELCRHVAIACASNLGVWSTNSYFGNDVAALEDHFRYDLDALYSPTATRDALTTDLEWGRLAGIGGANAQGGGHAWIVEGYDTSTDPNRLFWMNFGWGGASNGWYTFDNVPFPVTHDMMTRVAPTFVKFVGSTVAGDGSPAQPYRNLVEALAAAPDYSLLHFRAGSDHAWTGVINRPLVLKGYGAIVH